MFRRRSALCILDDKGKIVRETKLPTDPEIIARFIAATGLAIDRIGLESGCTAAWLFAGLQRYGWTVICIDARHAAAALPAGFRNKNDRNDARGIADLMRVNKYRPVWVKSPEAQRQGRSTALRVSSSGCTASSRRSSPIASRTAASNAVRLSVSPIPSWRSRPRIVFSRATSCDCNAARAVNSRKHPPSTAAS
jgi:hypothetical protein